MRRPTGGLNWDAVVGWLVCTLIATAFWGGVAWIALEVARRLRRAVGLG